MAAIQFLLKFTIASWPLALLLPWLAWEFQRRYSGNTPILVAVPFVLSPPFSWIFGFILFARYKILYSKVIRQRNRAAIAFSFSLLVPPMLLALTYVVLVGLMTIPKDSQIVAEVLLWIWLAVVMSSIYIPWRVFKHYRKINHKAEQGADGNPH